MSSSEVCLPNSFSTVVAAGVYFSVSGAFTITGTSTVACDPSSYVTTTLTKVLPDLCESGLALSLAMINLSFVASPGVCLSLLV